uniref:Uncharacterized protein n=1 Tax=viral metagenome TaxID=1070528 RepID=A0A6M3Y1G2_9ZZZZ
MIGLPIKIMSKIGKTKVTLESTETDDWNIKVEIGDKVVLTALCDLANIIPVLTRFLSR